MGSPFPVVGVGTLATFGLQLFAAVVPITEEVRLVAGRAASRG